jgi:dethiobiotin synthetase
MMPRGVFVTGTDTDAGKTVVSACLVSALGALYWKPIQTGLGELPGGDTAIVAQLTGHEPSDFPPPAFEYQAPISPDQAAALEGARIDDRRIVLPACEPFLVVEGAGGLMVPLNEATLMIDLAARFALPVVVAARTGLGTINHTLLTLEALKHRGLPIAGVVFSGPDHPHNIEAIRRLGGVPILGHIPRLEPLTPEAVAEAASRLDLSPLRGA